MAIKYKKITKGVLFVFLFAVLAVFCYLFVGSAPDQQNIKWGVNFSQKQAQNLGLDWKETYLAILDDLGAKNLKVASYWDLIENSQGEYDFNDLDWQIEEAEKKNAKIILVVGMKTPRWPECHIPKWAKDLLKESQQGKILELLEKTVSRYKDSSAITIWQVENEPFFPFGDCPWTDREFLKKEISKVRSLDQSRPVMVTDSGEFSFWIEAARYGDMVGATMYRSAWFHQFNLYLDYPIPPVFYYRKAAIIEKLFGKDIIGVELQAEPWGSKPIYDISVKEQLEMMSLEQFKENIKFAEKSGLPMNYFWGAEWWYWMKEKQNIPEIWQEAKKVFSN